MLLPPNTDFTGTWLGSGSFTNEWASPTCQYAGREKPPSVTLEVRSEGDQTKGVLSLEIKPSSPPCPPLKKRYELADIKVVGSRLAFMDPAGDSWDFALQAGTLVGFVGWRGGSADDPLAEGFLGPDGSAPPTRLQGDVSLKRQGAVATPIGPKGRTTTAGVLKGAGLLVVANAVAAGALVLTNQLTKQSGTATSNNCSPRSCVIGVPCLCNVQTSSSASCGTTSLGGTLGSPCNVTGNSPLPSDAPCAAGLSCNNNVCQDISTLCPVP